MALGISAPACWAFMASVLLTWTLTWDQVAVGAAVSVAVAMAPAPLGGVAAPWRLLGPRVLTGVVRLAVVSAGRPGPARAAPSVPLPGRHVVPAGGFHSDIHSSRHWFGALGCGKDQKVVTVRRRSRDSTTEAG